MKDYGLQTTTFIQRSEVYENTSRLRLQWDADESGWGVHLAFDNEYLSGSLLSSTEAETFGVSPRASYLNLNWNVAQGSQYLYRALFYRAYVENVSDAWTVRIGRQRVNWGTGKIWQPTDVLNPYQPLSIEPDERPGVDAVYLRRALGAFDQFELAYAPLNGWSDTSLLARVHQYYDIADMDVSFMGGKAIGGDGNTILGGDWSQTVGQGLMYGEWSYTHGDVVYWRYVFGYMLQLENSTTYLLKDAKVIGEYYHNGAGAFDPLHYDFVNVLNGREPWPVRDTAGVLYQKSLHPLVNLNGTAMWDLNDSEIYAGVSMDYSAATNLVTTAGVQTLSGGTVNSLGYTGRVFYVMAQYFFGTR